MSPAEVFIDVCVRCQLQGPRVILYRSRVLAKLHPRQSAPAEHVRGLVAAIAQVMIERLFCLFVASEREQGAPTDLMRQRLLRNVLQRSRAFLNRLFSSVVS